MSKYRTAAFCPLCRMEVTPIEGSPRTPTHGDGSCEAIGQTRFVIKKVKK